MFVGVIRTAAYRHLAILWRLLLYYIRRVMMYPFVQGVQLTRALGRRAWGVSLFLSFFA
jgi:hypothetical protein